MVLRNLSVIVLFYYLHLLSATAQTDTVVVYFKDKKRAYTALNADKQFGGTKNAAGLFPTRDAQFITNEQ